MAVQVNALILHELDYEIKIREVEPKGNMDEKRKLLRGLLSQESANRSFAQIKNLYGFKTDKKEILESLSSIKTKIGEFSGSKNDNKYKGLATRLWHVSGRISRMNTESEEQISEKKDLKNQVIILEADLDEKVSPLTSTPLTLAPALPNFDFNSLNKSVPVHKWGIQKFTGEGSLMAFLEKVESLRISRNCSTDELFASAGDLFDSQAWTWWHNNHIKNRFSDWSDLVQKLKETFLRDQYDKKLLDEIKSRKQNTRESVTMFISSMEGLFYRLTTVPDEQEIVDIIRENLLSDYVKFLALKDISTISELTNMCKKLENSFLATSQYKTPSFKGRFLEPDLSCPKFSGSLGVNSMGSVKCWNCLDLGHKYNECQKPKNIFCYGCGLKNVLKSKCRTCSKNGNASSGDSPPKLSNTEERDSKNQSRQNRK